MRIDIFDQAVELAASRSIVLHDAKQAEIVCTRGRIWITEDPLRNDIVLDPGEAHVVTADGLAFVTAVTASTVWLREPMHAPAGRRSQDIGLMARAASAVARMAAELRRRVAPGDARA